MGSSSAPSASSRVIGVSALPRHAQRGEITELHRRTDRAARRVYVWPTSGALTLPAA